MPAEATLFAKDARVQALATLFDAGTEDAQGRTYSQKRLGNGLGAYCVGIVTRVYRKDTRRRNEVQKYMVKWDEGTSTALEEQHLQLYVPAAALGSDESGDNEGEGMSQFLTRDGEETDDDEEALDTVPAAGPAAVPEDLFAVVTPLNGVVECGPGFRWKRVKSIVVDPRANQPEFEFSLRNMQISDHTSLNDILWLCMPVSRSELLETVRSRAGAPF
jgi:hypothetical protein